MSDEDQLGDVSEGQLLHAQYKDGQLQIIEVTPFDRNDKAESILPELDSDESQGRYVQVLGADKSLMQLDLLNMTLVKCDDGSDSYKLIANAETTSDIPEDATVTCVLQPSDNEDPDNQDAYVMVNDDQGPLVFLQSSLQPKNRSETQKEDRTQKQEKKALSPAELLERAKGLQKARTLLAQTSMPCLKSCGRKRKTDLPPPHQLLSSPNFKLFLYSCKMCNFKCNAIKEMTAHKVAEHGTGSGGSSRWRSGRSLPALQCARCPFKGGTHSQLMRHINDAHINKPSSPESNSDALQVLVCGACGFESSSRFAFKKHLEDEHGTTVR